MSNSIAAPIITIERRLVTYFAGSLVLHGFVLGVLAKLPEDDLSAATEVVLICPGGDPSPPPAEPEDDERSAEALGGCRMGKAEQKYDEDLARRIIAHVPSNISEGFEELPRSDPAVARAEAVEMARSGSIFAPDCDDPALVHAQAVARARNVSATVSLLRHDVANLTKLFDVCGASSTVETRATLDAGNVASDGPRHGPRPLVTMGEAEGIDCDATVIRRGIRHHLPAITHCYETQLTEWPLLSGAVVVQLTVSKTGEVTRSVGIGFDPTVASCVADVVATIKFPRAQTSAIVDYPFVFRTLAR